MLVLSGTNRPGSNTRIVAGIIFDRLNAISPPTTSKSKHYLLDLCSLRADIFDAGSYLKKPPWFEAEFQEPILAADGMIVVTPEYNGGFPGVLKYFIDMLKFPESLVGLPVAFVGLAAGQFGALRSVEQLELIFHYRKSHIFGERVFIPQINTVLSDSGERSDYHERLDSLVSSFAQFVDQKR